MERLAVEFHDSTVNEICWSGADAILESTVLRVSRSLPRQHLHWRT